MKHLVDTKNPKVNNTILSILYGAKEGIHSIH